MTGRAARIVAVLFLMACSCIHQSVCWEEEELEMFDLVEDIGQNFYDLLEVSEVRAVAADCMPYICHIRFRLAFLISSLY